MALHISKVLVALRLWLILLCFVAVVLGRESKFVKPSESVSTEKETVFQGAVYCKSYKYRGIDTLDEATPLEGALVRLQCNINQIQIVQNITTIKNGYFFVMPPKQLTLTELEQFCKVFLVSSPKTSCNIPTNLHNRYGGVTLKGSNKLIPPQENPKVDFYAIEPFAFEPSTEESSNSQSSRTDEVICNTQCIFTTYTCDCPNAEG